MPGTLIRAQSALFLNIGAAFEHEFPGSSESMGFGHSVAAPSFEGSSGMGEFGLMMKPAEILPLSFNLGVQGYAVQKQGISGNCAMMYENCNPAG